MVSKLHEGLLKEFNDAKETEGKSESSESKGLFDSESVSSLEPYSNPPASKPVKESPKKEVEIESLSSYKEEGLLFERSFNPFEKTIIPGYRAPSEGEADNNDLKEEFFIEY